MATGHNRFSAVGELSSPAFWKAVATVSLRRGYAELPELSDNPLPSYTAYATGSATQVQQMSLYTLHGYNM